MAGGAISTGTAAWKEDSTASPDFHMAFLFMMLDDIWL